VSLAPTWSRSEWAAWLAELGLDWIRLDWIGLDWIDALVCWRFTGWAAAGRRQPSCAEQSRAGQGSDSAGGSGTPATREINRERGGESIIHLDAPSRPTRRLSSLVREAERDLEFSFVSWTNGSQLEPASRHFYAATLCTVGRPLHWRRRPPASHTRSRRVNGRQLVPESCIM